MKNAIYLFVFSFLIIGCQSNSTKQSTETQETNTQSTKKYKISDFTESPAFPDAKIESMMYKDGKFKFGIGEGSYELGAQTPDAPQKMCANSGKGQHIHLIVDNAPYAAKYTNEFEYDIADGEHYLLAFLSRSYHESIKTSAAHTAMKIEVKNKSIADVNPISDPMLFYSRPKGTYVGKADTEKIMLDYYLVNAASGEYKVQAEINGEQTEVFDTWKPYFIEGLPMGENTIKLTLLNKDGSVADVPLNPVERTFTLKEDPAPGQ